MQFGQASSFLAPGERHCIARLLALMLLLPLVTTWKAKERAASGVGAVAQRAASLCV